MPEELISVVVPTFNRAHLLARTLPTYLQPEVGEIIVVDDCSTDGTQEAIRALQRKDARVKSLRCERNLKQTHAKNWGTREAVFPLVYYGDDDSILIEGSLAALLRTMKERRADIVGARAPYMETPEDEADVPAFLSRLPLLKGPIVEPLSLHVHFDRDAPGPLEAPFVHAAFLTRKELAIRILFDEGYRGNCYREETDFLVRARAAGASVWYEPRAVQANLPRAGAGGGAHGTGPQGGSAFVARRLRYFSEAARNNWRFLRKNKKALAFVLGVDPPILYRQALFLSEIARVILRWPFRKAAGRHGGR
jgi:glycosyltransferase involved in cell wall biosynthesis